MNSDFPEFDQAYQTVLVKDPDDIFERLAAEANFNIYHSDIWRGTARKFAESIVRECVGVADKNVIGTDKVGKAIKQHFGIDND